MNRNRATTTRMIGLLMLVSVNDFLLLSMCLGASLPYKSSAPAPIELPMRRETPSKASRLATRDAKVSPQNLGFDGVRYYIDYQIGGQTQSAILDTGSSDTWTFSRNAWTGGYTPGRSKDYKWHNNGFRAAYGDGSATIQGTWGSDTISIAGVSVPDYSFAYLNESRTDLFPDNRGIFGIGPQSSENVARKYPTFAERLHDAGVIPSNSFSIFNNNDSQATLLLGGVDSSRHYGDLSYVSLDDRQIYGNRYYAIDYRFNGETLTGGVLDTGTPFVLLPRGTADDLAEQYGASWSESDGCYVSNGGHSRTNIPSLEFTIGEWEISIPGNEMFTLNAGKYLFAVARSITGPFYSLNILGDPILRQLYLLFDVDNNRVGVAPVKR